MIVDGGNAFSIPGLKIIAVTRSTRAVAPGVNFSKDGDEHSALTSDAIFDGSIDRISDGDELSSLTILMTISGGSEDSRYGDVDRVFINNTG